MAERERAIYDGPTTFREVGYIIREMQGDITELKESMRNVSRTIIVGVVCPIATGIVTGIILAILDMSRTK